MEHHAVVERHHVFAALVADRVAPDLHAAPGVAVTAYAPDGVVEALEVPEKRFMLSVQWHPEDLYDGDEAMDRLFRAFVDAAGEYAERRHVQR